MSDFYLKTKEKSGNQYDVLTVVNSGWVEIRWLLGFSFLYFFNFKKIWREKNKKDKLRISAFYQLNSNHASVICACHKFKDRLIGLAGQNGL